MQLPNETNPSNIVSANTMNAISSKYGLDQFKMNSAGINVVYDALIPAYSARRWTAYTRGGVNYFAFLVYAINPYKISNNAPEKRPMWISVSSKSKCMAIFNMYVSYNSADSAKMQDLIINDYYKSKYEIFMADLSNGVYGDVSDMSPDDKRAKFAEEYQYENLSSSEKLSFEQSWKLKNASKVAFLSNNAITVTGYIGSAEIPNSMKNCFSAEQVKGNPLDFAEQQNFNSLCARIMSDGHMTMTHTLEASQIVLSNIPLFDNGRADYTNLDYLKKIDFLKYSDENHLYNIIQCNNIVTGEIAVDSYNGDFIAGRKVGFSQQRQNSKAYLSMRGCLTISGKESQYIPIIAAYYEQTFLSGDANSRSSGYNSVLQNRGRSKLNIRAELKVNPVNGSDSASAFELKLDYISFPDENHDIESLHTPNIDNLTLNSGSSTIPEFEFGESNSPIPSDEQVEEPVKESSEDASEEDLLESVTKQPSGDNNDSQDNLDEELI